MHDLNAPLLRQPSRVIMYLHGPTPCSPCERYCRFFFLFYRYGSRNTYHPASSHRGNRLGFGNQGYTPNLFETSINADYRIQESDAMIWEARHT